MKIVKRLPTLLLFFVSAGSNAAAPTIDPAEDAQHFGDSQNVLFWTPEQKVAGFRNDDRLYPSRRVLAGDSPYPPPE